MSRTEEDIESGVDITIMRDAALSTYPASYSEVCDTFRPRLAGARRTDSGRERFIHFRVPSPVRRRFIAEHVSEGRPACIKNRLRQAGLGLPPFAGPLRSSEFVSQLPEKPRVLDLLRPGPPLFRGVRRLR